MTRRSPDRDPSALRRFLDSEATGGLILVGAATLALVLANSPLAPAYFGGLERDLGGRSVLHWVNDGLMALFFLLIGLEVKREFIAGELSTWPRRALPGFAAAGGMLVPALIYVAVNAGQPANLRGWAIPTATDIAFALGVLMLLGRRVPVSLKVFLTALAIIDDLGAVIIIAAVYTAEVEMLWLALAGVLLAILYGLNRLGVAKLTPYVLLGLLLWYVMLRSGVHATLAGIALAMTVPIRTARGRIEDGRSPLHRLEHKLQPWVAFAIVPLFGFANAGVSLLGLGWDVALAEIPLGIALGLFVGKQVGVFSFSWLALRLGLADPPRDASAAQLYGVSVLCGIGFTMSLFIGLLAFPGAAEVQQGVKAGVLAGSLCSALLGSAILALARPERVTRPAADE